MCGMVTDATDADTCSANSRSCDSTGQCLKVDQQQLMRDASLGLGGNSEQKVAQVVSPGAAGNLVEVRLVVSCSPGAAITVQIQGVTSAGAPDGNVLSSRTIEPGPLPLDTTSMRSIRLTTPLTVSVGKRFSIIAIGPQTDSCGIILGPGGDTYPGGKSFYDARPEPPGWKENTADLPFQTLVQ